ncbi:beta strand repeat-containing protein, partial [Undibacterium sp. RuTC16W]|uniref:beta strand repeat-containing protein n=1 Tax=Undibacterium sp. RuTC16W TaxID=3413048 RepID=UPI003BF2D03D
MNSTQIVNQVYTNLFGRAAEPSGLLYWALLLDQKSISISNVVTQIAAGAQGTDLVAYTSKVSAATSFTAAVDTNLEIVGYSGTPSLTLAKAFIAGVTDAATLATAIVPATLDATVLAVTSAAAGQTFALTTGIDTIVGTSGNDTISSLTSGVLTALDNIDGGAGNDTMSLTSIAAIAIPTTATVKNVETVNLTSALDVNGNVSGWTGLTKLSVVSAAAGNETIVAATTTSVTEANSTGQRINVVGGGNAGVFTNGAGATVIGNGGVGAASASGAIAGGNLDNTAPTAIDANAYTSITTSGGLTVDIADNSGTSGAIGSTLKTVSISGNGSNAKITANGLTSVTEANTASNLTILAAAATRTLGVTVNTVTAGTITDATATTVNVTSTGAANVVADLAVAAATAVTLGGDKALTLTTTHFGAATALTVNDSALVTVSGYNTTNKLTTVTVTGAGGFTSDLSGQGSQLT